MVHIQARFSLTETTRVRCYVEDPTNKDNKWIPTEGCRARLQPVQGEPFGSATPSGNLEMVIANPDAANVFLQSPIGAEFNVVFSPVKPD